VIHKLKQHTANEDDIILKTRALCRVHNPHFLMFDKTGLGHFLAPKLEAAVNPGCTVIPRNFGADSPAPDCAKTRDWIYRRLRDWVQAGGWSGKNAELTEDLKATEYTLDDKGRMKLLPKDKIRVVIGRSPDDADALALSCGYTGNLEVMPAGSVRSQTRDMAKALADDTRWD